MVGRAFSVKIDLDLHAVSCPGVWLCPNGKVALQINIFNKFSSTQKIVSTFPLLYHNRFTFKKIFVNITTLAQLEKKLFREYIFFKLIQWSSTVNRDICLATFKTNLTDLLYPVSSFKGLLAGVDVDLLMEPTKFFPGILSPKIEVSTKTTIEEVTDINNDKTKMFIINPKTLNSLNQHCINKKKVSLPSREFKQKKVCHTGQRKINFYICRICRDQKSNTEDDWKYNSCYHCFLHSVEKCYLSSTQKKETSNYLTTTTNKSSHNYTVFNDVHIFDKCPICLKYKCYFSKKNSYCNSLSKLHNNINYQNSINKCIENKKLICGFKCNTNHENCVIKGQMLSNTINPLNLEKDVKNNNYKINNRDTNFESCILEKYKNSFICKSNNQTVKNDQISSILLAKMKQLEETKKKLNYVNYSYRNIYDIPISNSENYQVE